MKLLFLFALPLLAQVASNVQLQQTFGPGVWVRQGTILNATVSWEVGTLQEPRVLQRSSGCQIVASPCFGMWYTGGGSTMPPAIGYAESTDGKTGWTKYSMNPVITSHSRGDIYHEGSTLYELLKNENTQNLDLYTSPDTNGLTWTLNTANVISKGSAGQFDQDAIENSTIIKNGSTYDVIYEGRNGAGNTAVYRCGAATASSISGPYTKDAGNPVVPAPVCGGPQLYKDGSGNLWLWNHGDVNVQPQGFARWTSSSIGGAWTANPATNTMYRGGVFLTGSPDETPYPGGVADGWRVDISGPQVFLYYSGTANEFNVFGNSHIKLAIAAISEATLVTGIEGMTTTAP